MDMSSESALNLVAHNKVDSDIATDSMKQSVSGNQPELYPKCPDEEDDKDGAKENLSTSLREAIIKTLRQKCSPNFTILGRLSILINNGEFVEVNFEDERSESHASPQCSPSVSKRKAYHPRKISASSADSVDSSLKQEPGRQWRSQRQSRMEKEDEVLDLSVGGSLGSSRINTPEKPPQEQQQQQHQEQQQQVDLLPIPNFGLLFAEALTRMANSGPVSASTTPLSLPQAQQQLKSVVDVSVTPLGPLPPAKRMRVSGGDGGIGGGGGRSSSGVKTGSRTGRRFACNLCEEVTFGSLGELERHTRTTHGSYECHECHARFTQRSNLQRHALRHVGFKPFICRLCGRAYYRKDHLTRHMVALHPDLPTPTSHQHVEVHLTSSEALDFLRFGRRELQQQQKAKHVEKEDETVEQRRQEELLHDLHTDNHIVSEAAAASSSGSGVSLADGATVDSKFLASTHTP